MKRSLLSFWIATLLVGALPALFGQENITWVNTDGGDFSDDNNWSDGVPTAADRALIDAQGSYTIYLDQERAITGLEMNGSEGSQDVTLNLGGYRLLLTGTGNADFYVVSSIDSVRTLRIVNGQLEGNRLRVDSSLNAEQPGRIVVGQDGVLIAGSPTAGDSRVGNGALGLLEVVDNGRVEIGHTLHVGTLNDYPTAKGMVIIDGAEARFTGRHVHLGSSQEGHMHVINGAQAQINGTLALANSLGRPNGSRGFLEVSSGGYLNVTGAEGMRVGNTSGNAAKVDDPELIVSRIGHATIASDGLIETTRLRVFAGSTLKIDGGAVVASANSEFSSGAIYEVSLNSLKDTPLQVNNLSLGGATLAVQLGENFNAELGAVYTLIDYTGGLTGQFVDLEGQALNNGDLITVGDYIFSLQYGNLSDGIVGLELTAIPEPGAFVLWTAVLVACGVVFLPRHRNNQSQ